MSLFDLFSSELYLVWYSTVVSDNENRMMIERQLVADKIYNLSQYYQVLSKLVLVASRKSSYRIFNVCQRQHELRQIKFFLLQSYIII